MSCQTKFLSSGVWHRVSELHSGAKIQPATQMINCYPHTPALLFWLWVKPLKNTSTGEKQHTGFAQWTGACGICTFTPTKLHVCHKTHSQSHSIQQKDSVGRSEAVGFSDLNAIKFHYCGIRKISKILTQRKEATQLIQILGILQFLRCKNCCGKNPSAGGNKAWAWNGETVYDK